MLEKKQKMFNLVLIIQTFSISTICFGQDNSIYGTNSGYRWTPTLGTGQEIKVFPQTTTTYLHH